MKKARFELSLRFLLLLTAFAAVFLGHLSHWIYRAEQQRVEMKELRNKGCNIGYKVHANDCRAKVGDRVAMDMIASPKEIFCNVPSSERVAIDDITKISTVEHLVLSMSGVTDDDLESLDKMPNLKHLNVSGTRVSDVGIEILTDLHLISLHLNNLNLTIASAKSLGKISTLKWLDLTPGVFTESALADLKTALPDCETHFSP